MKEGIIEEMIGGTIVGMIEEDIMIVQGLGLDLLEEEIEEVRGDIVEKEVEVPIEDLEAIVVKELTIEEVMIEIETGEALVEVGIKVEVEVLVIGIEIEETEIVEAMVAKNIEVYFI